MKLWGRPRRRYSVMTTARWEAPYIAEWLAYHRAIGFDHVYLYCNDDDPGELYTAAAAWIEGPDPFVTFVHCLHQGQQWWMILHFLQTHKDETEWVAFLDVDEFLSLRRDANIDAFMRRRPADADCIYFYWTLFGHAGFAERPAGSVLRRYTRRQTGLNAYTKTITRTARIEPERLKPEVRGNIVHPHHGWDAKFSTPGLRSYDVLGAQMGDYWGDTHPARFEALFAEPGRVARVFEEAVVHHYFLRSEADFRRRVARGLAGDFAGQVIWGRKADAGEGASFLAELDAVEDRTLADWWEGWLAREAAGRGMYPEAPAPLISRGCACLQSSGWSPDGTEPDLVAQAAGAVDGRPLTGRYAFHSAVEDAPWWRVDLGGAHRIAEVRLYNRMDDAEMPERGARIAIAVSDDARAWRRVFSKTDDAGFGGVDGRPLCWRPPSPVTARFVRVELLRRGILHLEQVEVFGAPA